VEFQKIESFSFCESFVDFTLKDQEVQFQNQGSSLSQRHHRMLSLSNHSYYTDSYGQCTLPFLYDRFTEDGLARPLPRETTRTYCDSCGNQPRDEYIGGVPVYEHIYPCVLYGEREPYSRGHTELLPGIFQDGTISEYEMKVACEAEFLLCDKCSIRADAIMEVSDHIASGENWWIICKRLSDKIHNELWEKWGGGEEIATREAAKTMCILEHAVNDKGETGPFSLLPNDILSLLAPYIKGAGLSRFATKIQALWRGYRVRAHPEAKRWFPYCAKTLYQSQCENMWAKCDDCGMKRRTADMFVMDACADHNDCCHKVVCREACCYTCPACGDTNFVKCDDKNMNGSPTYFDCLCGESFLLNEQWWGLSDEEYQRRYN